jgi:hypothetical protein
MTHVAFLRAVNVGGRGLVKMTDLQEAFTAAGAKNVRTVIASGNVIFEAPGALGPLRARIGKTVRPLPAGRADRQPAEAERLLRVSRSVDGEGTRGAIDRAQLVDDPAHRKKADVNVGPYLLHRPVYCTDRRLCFAPTASVVSHRPRQRRSHPQSLRNLLATSTLHF